MSLYFILLVLKQVNPVVVLTTSMIHMQKSVPDVVKNINVKVFNLMSRTNETRHIENGMKHVSVNVDQMQVFVTINNIGMMISAGVNAKN